jgi:hypothetical protein
MSTNMSKLLHEFLGFICVYLVTPGRQILPCCLISPRIPSALHAISRSKRDHRFLCDTFLQEIVILMQKLRNPRQKGTQLSMRL